MGRLLWFLWFLLTGLVQAEPYGLVVIDEVKQLDRPALQQAAEPLLQRGASVAVVLVRHGDERDVVKQLSQLGLWSGTQIAPAGILVYVSLDPRYSQLRAGTRFSDDLAPAALEEVRQEMLNPQLRQEHFQKASVASLQGLEQRLAHRLTAKQWIQRGTLAVLTFVGLHFLGFWEWLGESFWGSSTGKGLLRLWARTPGARRQERERLEKLRLKNLAILQESLSRLAAARQRSQPLTSRDCQELEALSAESEATQTLSAVHLVDLIGRIRLQTEDLSGRGIRWEEASKTLERARISLGKLKSQLKDRKKTRHLPEQSPFPELGEEIAQEQQLRERYVLDGAEAEDVTRSVERCQHLLERVEGLWKRHFSTPKKAAPGQAHGTSYSSAGEPYSTPTNDSSSSYEDRSSCDPPSSSSESVAGGDW